MRQRLFTALSIPEDVQQRLAEIQPQSNPGLRLVAAHQFHITLQFIGEADPAMVSAAIASCPLPAFPIRLHGVGAFHGRDRSTTIWAGVALSESLRSLHADLSRRLQAAIGLRPESRPYAPHVTLARCTSAVPSITIRNFLAAHAPAEPGTWTAHSFGLWSSELSPEGPRYRLEQEFPLTSPITNFGS